MYLKLKRLDELIAKVERTKDSPIKTKVLKEKFLFLSKNKSISWPTWLTYLQGSTRTIKIILLVLANLCRWLSRTS